MKSHTKYQRLAEILRERLQSHPNGERLPSVRAMMKRFQVSQHTVMSALRILEEEGLLLRRHGSGLYRSDVSRPVVIAHCRPKALSTDLDLKEDALQAACDARGWKLHVHRFDPMHVDVFAEEIRASAFMLQPEMVTFHSPLLSRLVPMPFGN